MCVAAISLSPCCFAVALPPAEHYKNDTGEAIKKVTKVKVVNVEKKVYKVGPCVDVVLYINTCVLLPGVVLGGGMATLGLRQLCVVNLWRSICIMSGSTRAQRWALLV